MEFDKEIEGKIFHFKNIGPESYLVMSAHDSWIIYRKTSMHKKIVWACADETLSQQMVDIFGRQIDQHRSMTTSGKK